MYVAWLRAPGKRYSAVAESTADDVALNMAREHADAAGIRHRDIVVLPAGQTPWRRSGRPTDRPTGGSAGERLMHAAGHIGKG
jgi:hypothetical protein